MERVSNGAFSLLVLTFALAACGTIWGFEDALDREPLDAGAVDGDTQGSSSSGGEDSVVPAPNAPGVSCVPPPPPGWQGPLAIVELTGAPLPASPPCPDQYTLVYDGNADPDARPGACTCSCTPPNVAGLTCGAPVANFYNENGCTQACGTPNQIVPKSCQTFAATCADAKFVKVTDAVPKGGSCTAMTNGAPPAVSWNKSIRLCEPQGVTATCPGTKVPAATSRLPYAPGNYCIASQSDLECPAAYPKRRTYFDPTQVTDGRGCNPCSCGALSGKCGGQLHTGDNGCAGGEKFITVPASCGEAKLSNKSWEYIAPNGPPTDVKCEASGGGPSGSFVANAPIYVCCRF